MFWIVLQLLPIFGCYSRNLHFFYQFLGVMFLNFKMFRKELENQRPLSRAETVLAWNPNDPNTLLQFKPIAFITI